MKLRWEKNRCFDDETGARVGHINSSGSDDTDVHAFVGETRIGRYISESSARGAVETNCLSQGHPPSVRKNMISELSQDLKAFIREHRNTFFWIAFAFLADHFFFNGAFRARLNTLVEKIIGKIEKRVDEIPHA